MATILQFRQTVPATRSESSDGLVTGAEIIIFPGIRYERWDEGDAAHTDVSELDASIDHAPKPRRRASGGGGVSAASQRKRSKPQRKRDILEIPD